MNLSTDPSIQKQLKEEGLRFVYDKDPGFFRQKIGRGFKFYDTNGKVINDEKTIDRIEGLVIPPAWKNVWISPKINGHIQATGVDEKQRKQYIYHPDWIKLSQQNKFSKMTDFGMNLPKIRGKVNHNLRSQKQDKQKLIATVIWLLEHTFIRVGNEEYSKENNSFGLTTLRNRHVKVNGSKISFAFKGKSGVYSNLEVTNPLVAKIIKNCMEIPGYELFQFIDEKGDRHVIESDDINLFLKDVTKDDFSAKDFRTWGATNLSANQFYKIGNTEDAKQLKQNIVDTVKIVAKKLNNTVSVCRNYYIHPTVIKTYQEKLLIPHFDYFSKNKPIRKHLGWDETALIKLLQKHS